MEEAGPRFSAVSLLADGGPAVPLLSLHFLVSQSAVPILVWGAVPLPRSPLSTCPSRVTESSSLGGSPVHGGLRAGVFAVVAVRWCGCRRGGQRAALRRLQALLGPGPGPQRGREEVCFSSGLRGRRVR